MSQSSHLASQDLAAALATNYPALARYCPNLSTISVQQAAFLLSDAREAFYGGAAGGGKSDALLMAALMYVDVPGYRALILRRTFAQLAKGDALIPRAHEWLALSDAIWNEQKRTWTFPSGSTLEFGHVKDEVDKFDYQGAAFQFVGFDELTQFSESQYNYIGFSRARRRKAMREQGIPIRTRATSNPGGEGHVWVKSRFIDSRSPEVVFIPAKVQDNPGLDVDEYAASLAYLPDELRKQLLDGDWGAFEGAAYTVRPDHLVDPLELEDAWRRREGMDYGINNPTAWLAACTDYDGNVIVFDEHYQPALPSETAPVILGLRQTWGQPELCVGDPNSLAMRTGTVRRMGDPATIETEFNDNGVAIQRGNDNPRAGYTRIRELLKLDPERRFPDWHHRRGEYGSPRLFIVEQTCPHVVGELRAALLQPIEKRHGGEMVAPDWESQHGHAHAALRYLALSYPSPSDKPYEPLDSPRAEFIRTVIAGRDTRRARPADYLT